MSRKLLGTAGTVRDRRATGGAFMGGGESHQPRHLADRRGPWLRLRPHRAQHAAAAAVER